MTPPEPTGYRACVTLVRGYRRSWDSPPSRRKVHGVTHEQALIRLHATWLVHSAEDPESFDADSLSFLHAALYPAVRAVSANRITSWLDVVEAIEARAAGPSEDGTTITLGPRAASNFLTHQRRRRLHLCQYQVARLELLPQFSWAPVDDVFDRRIAQLRAHLTEYGSAPRLKSEDPSERSLARWLRHARDRDTQGHLSADASAALRAMAPAQR